MSTDHQVEQAAREALSEFTLALRWSGGEDAEARFGIGRCLEIVGDVAGAESALEGASSTLPSAKLALIWLWGRRLMEGRKDRDWKALILQRVPAPHPARMLAEGSWEKLLKLPMVGDQEGDMLVLAEGVAAIELGRWDESLALLDRVLRVRPRDSTVLYYRGRALMGKGDRTAALAAWADALKNKPTDWPLHAEIAKRQHESADK